MDVDDRVDELVPHLAEVVFVLPGEILQRPALVELADDALGSEVCAVSVEPPGGGYGQRTGACREGLKQPPLAAAIADEDARRWVTAQYETLARAGRPLDPGYSHLPPALPRSPPVAGPVRSHPRTAVALRPSTRASSLAPLHPSRR